ncbi:MAG: type I-D CRISPR-associated protein Cas5/Csc1 [archaeon]|nr:type I-D CRISPR-associated protein Cas5/Csc1 [archaeon]
MIQIFRYGITLLDALFYSREGLSGAITPKYLHATAVNHAATYALGINPENQPYIISEDNGGRNTARYENSLICEDFYFTPARPKDNITYQPEIAKGELDGFAKKGYGAGAGGRAEVLKASLLFFIPPEINFEGYLVCAKELEFPKLIRLGSFRGKARLTLEEVKIVREKEEELVDHPVDPLVCETMRGVMINMFPYPIVENAVCKNCIEIRDKGLRKYVALPSEFHVETSERPKSGTLIF